jgi:hypothetical protein
MLLLLLIWCELAFCVALSVVFSAAFSSADEWHVCALHNGVCYFPSTEPRPVQVRYGRLAADDVYMLINGSSVRCNFNDDDDDDDDDDGGDDDGGVGVDEGDVRKCYILGCPCCTLRPMKSYCSSRNWEPLLGNLPCVLRQNNDPRRAIPPSPSITKRKRKKIRARKANGKRKVKKRLIIAQSGVLYGLLLDSLVRNVIRPNVARGWSVSYYGSFDYDVDTAAHRASAKKFLQTRQYYQTIHDTFHSVLRPALVANLTAAGVQVQHLVAVEDEDSHADDDHQRMTEHALLIYTEEQRRNGFEVRWARRVMHLMEIVDAIESKRNGNQDGSINDKEETAKKRKDGDKESDAGKEEKEEEKEENDDGDDDDDDDDDDDGDMVFVLRIREDAAFLAEMNLDLIPDREKFYFRPCVHFGGISDKVVLSPLRHTLKFWSALYHNFFSPTAAFLDMEQNMLCVLSQLRFPFSIDMPRYEYQDQHIFTNMTVFGLPVTDARAISSYYLAEESVEPTWNVFNPDICVESQYIGVEKNYFANEINHWNQQCGDADGDNLFYHYYSHPSLHCTPHMLLQQKDRWWTFQAAKLRKQLKREVCVDRWWSASEWHGARWKLFLAYFFLFVLFLVVAAIAFILRRKMSTKTKMKRLA